MSTHSYSRLWTHLIWETLNRAPMLDKRATAKAWGLGYGAFSVSHSDVGRVARYIADQQEHHRKRTYSEEYAMLEWRAEGNH